jgi:hypothetical protein
MNSIKLLSLLSTLDEKEKKLLFFFLEDQKKWTRLVKFLLNNEYVDSKQLFKAVFANEIYDDKKLRNTLYAINKYIEKIIAMRFIQENNSLNNYILMNHCFQNNLSKEYNGYLQKLKQNKTGNSDNLMYEYLSQKIHLEYLEEKKRQFIQEDLIIKDQLLDAFYFKEKLWNLFEIDVYKNTYSFDYTPNVSEIIQQIDFSGFQFAESSLLFLKLLLLMMKEFDNDAHFYEAINILDVSHESISRKDLRLYYIALINYVIKKLNSGKNEFRDELFRIYTLQIKQSVLLNEKHMLEPYAYKNIITIAFQKKEFIWAKKFIEEYVQYLPNEVKENAYQYNMANYYYFTKNFAQCLRVLQTVQFTDVYYNLDARSIILKIYFEEKEWNLLFDHCFAFKVYVLRHKDISEHHKKGYLNLIKWTQKISNSINSPNKMNIIAEKISAEKNVRELKWILEQIKAA